MGVSGLSETEQLRPFGDFKRFADDEPRAVLMLLAGPGVVWTSPSIPLPIRCGEGESAVDPGRRSQTRFAQGYHLSGFQPSLPVS